MPGENERNEHGTPRFVNVVGAQVGRCASPTPVDVLLRIAGAQSGGIRLDEQETPSFKTLVVPASEVPPNAALLP